MQNRKLVLLIMGVLITALLLGIFLVSNWLGRPGPRPFVFLISIDTVGAKHLGLYGNLVDGPEGAVDTMPFLSSLAAEAVVFDNAVTVASQSAPGHAAMFTGVHPINLGMYKNGIPLKSSWPTIMTELGQAGYRTYGLPNTVVLGPQVAGFHNGFNEFRVITHVQQFDNSPIPARSYRLLHDYLQQHLNTYPDVSGFFWLHNDYAHGPYRYPPRWSKHFKMPAGIKGRERLPVDLKTLHTQNQLPTAKQLQVLQIRHYRALRFMDDMFKGFFERLKDLGILERSLVIIVADHGETFEPGTSGGHSGILTEDILRIPLLIRFPQAQFAGTRVRELVDQRDILPTILHYLKLPVPASTEGRSLLPMIAGRKVWKEHVLVSAAAPLRIFSARNSEYKLIEKGRREGLANHAEISPFLPQDTLFRIADNSVVPNPAADKDAQSAFSRLRQAIDQYKTGTKTDSTPVPDAVLKMLYDSGYLDPDQNSN